MRTNQRPWIDVGVFLRIPQRSSAKTGNLPTYPAVCKYLWSVFLASLFWGWRLLDPSVCWMIEHHLLPARAHTLSLVLCRQKRFVQIPTRLSVPSSLTSLILALARPSLAGLPADLKGCWFTFLGAETLGDFRTCRPPFHAVWSTPGSGPGLLSALLRKRADLLPQHAGSTELPVNIPLRYVSEAPADLTIPLV